MNVSTMQNEKKSNQVFFKFSYKIELSLMDSKCVSHYIVLKIVSISPNCAQ